MTLKKMEEKSVKKNILREMGIKPQEEYHGVEAIKS